MNHVLTTMSNTHAILIGITVVCLLYITPDCCYGEIPAKPPPPECLESKNTNVTCIFYLGDDNDLDSELCGKVSSIFTYEVLDRKCRERVSNLTLQIVLGFPEVRMLTTVENSFGIESNLTYQTPIIRPDPPRITSVVPVDEDTLNVTFEIPDTWKKADYLRYEGKFNISRGGVYHSLQNQIETGDTIHLQEKTFLLPLKNKPPSYSLVCVTLRVKSGMLGSDVTSHKWSDYSQLVCTHTPMTGPSKEPQNLSFSYIDRLDAPWLRNVNLTWMPPPVETWNGIIDHHEIVICDGQGRPIRPAYEVNSNASHYVIPDLRSSESYMVKLTSWTSGGASPVASLILDAVPVVPWWPVALFGAAFIILLLGCSACALKRILSSDHLPDPYFIPQETMAYHLSRKRRPPPEKEVFDELIVPTRPDSTGESYGDNMLVPSETPASPSDYSRAHITSSGDSGIDVDRTRPSTSDEVPFSVGYASKALHPVYNNTAGEIALKHPDDAPSESGSTEYMCGSKKSGERRNDPFIHGEFEGKDRSDEEDVSPFYSNKFDENNNLDQVYTPAKTSSGEDVIISPGGAPSPYIPLSSVGSLLLKQSPGAAMEDRIRGHGVGASFTSPPEDSGGIVYSEVFFPRSPVTPQNDDYIALPRL